MKDNRIFLKKDELGNDLYIKIISEVDTNNIKTHWKNDELLKDTIGLVKDDILAYGKVEYPPLSLLNRIIDCQEITRREPTATNIVIGTKDVMYKSYKCFHLKNYDMRNTLTIMHEDKHCSWNCLMSELKDPEYILIYKEHNDGE
jgi:hypothetical protein